MRDRVTPRHEIRAIDDYCACGQNKETLVVERWTSSALIRSYRPDEVVKDGRSSPLCEASHSLAQGWPSTPFGRHHHCKRHRVLLTTDTPFGAASSVQSFYWVARAVLVMLKPLWVFAGPICKITDGRVSRLAPTLVWSFKAPLPHGEDFDPRGVTVDLRCADRGFGLDDWAASWACWRPRKRRAHKTACRNDQRLGTCCLERSFRETGRSRLSFFRTGVRA